MPHHARSVHASEGTLILNEGPDLFIGQDLPEPDHAGAGRAIFNDPEEFAFGAMSPKSVVLKITRRGIQLGTPRSFSVSVRTMTGEADTFAVVHRFSLLNDFRRIRERAREGSGFSQLIRGHSRLHHVSLCGTGRSRTTDRGDQ